MKCQEHLIASLDCLTCTVVALRATVAQLDARAELDEGLRAFETKDRIMACGAQVSRLTEWTTHHVNQLHARIDGLTRREPPQVTDQEVLAELLELQRKTTCIELVTDRKVVEKGDLAVIDFFGFINGETFKGGKGINYTVEVGGGQMIPGFEDNIIGLTFGEQGTFTLTYPEDDGSVELGASPKIRGKSVEWRVDLKEIKRKTMCELDDEFAKDLGEYDTLDELKADIRKKLQRQRVVSAGGGVASEPQGPMPRGIAAGSCFIPNHLMLTSSGFQPVRLLGGGVDAGDVARHVRCDENGRLELSIRDLAGAIDAGVNVYAPDGRRLVLVDDKKEGT